VVLALVFCFFWVKIANAQSVGPSRPIKFCDVCAGFTVSKRGTDVLIRCPGAPIATPWMTIRECSAPKVDRTQPSNVSITCSLVKTAQESNREIVLFRDMVPLEQRPVLMACVN
jgi:hypothetical protein